MIRIITVLLFLVALFVRSQAQTTLSEEIRNNINARIDNGINTGIVIGIIDADGTRYYSYGVKSLKSKEPVNEHSVFEIGSITKTFTGIILANLVLKGKMKLEDPLQKYLPKGVTAPTRNEASIKLINLINHTSSLPGMPNNFAPVNPANPFADYTEKQMYDFLTSYQLNRDIGSQYEYSNYAVGLLGHILAAREGKSYEQLMIEVIANPLGLQNTRIVFTPSMKKNLAMGHSGDIQVENWDITSLAGAGAIRSTAVDMLKYLSANMGKVKSRLYPAMQLSHKNSRTESSRPMVGLGWHLANSGDNEIIWHNGGTGGYRAFIGFTKGGDKGVVVLSNSNASVDDIGMHLLNPKSPLKEIETSITVDANILENYVGQYQLVPGFILTVSRDGNQLKVQATGQPEFPVFPKAKNVFYYKVVEAQLTFNQNEEGKVQSVTLHQAGREMVGNRKEE
jgi:serine-type D-Ala-D-Ala carboxypeptidase/endopeptidase